MISFFFRLPTKNQFYVLGAVLVLFFDCFNFLSAQNLTSLNDTTFAVQYLKKGEALAKSAKFDSSNCVAEPKSGSRGTRTPKRITAHCFQDSFLIQPDDFQIQPKSKNARAGFEPAPRRSERLVLPLDDLARNHLYCFKRQSFIR